MRHISLVADACRVSWDACGAEKNTDDKVLGVDVTRKRGAAWRRVSEFRAHVIGSPAPHPTILQSAHDQAISASLAQVESRIEATGMIAEIVPFSYSWYSTCSTPPAVETDK
jgi:hypothetical protein